MAKISEFRLKKQQKPTQTNKTLLKNPKNLPNKWQTPFSNATTKTEPSGDQHIVEKSPTSPYSWLFRE
jgi:hypothetical protein